MKKILVFKLLLFFSLSSIFVSCGPGIDATVCEKMILEHPFFDETYVTVTDKKVPECEEAYAGCKKNWYITMSGMKDAHFYYMYGFGIANMRDVLIEEKRASCIFDLVYANETVACKFFDDRRIDDKMECKAYFTKYEDGWKLDKIVPAERYFTINVWRGSTVQYNINFNSYGNS